MPLAQFILYAGHAQAALIPHIKALGQLDKWPGHPAVACGLVGLSSRLTKLTANIDNDDDSGAWTMPASASVSAVVAALPCARHWTTVAHVRDNQIWERSVVPAP